MGPNSAGNLANIHLYHCSLFSVFDTPRKYCGEGTRKNADVQDAGWN